MSINDSEDGNARQLRTSYAAWIGTPDDSVKSAIAAGLIVLDANVLLALYEVGAPTRDEVFLVLESVRSRIWVPHQAALEFSKNRRRVVIDRVSLFKRVRSEVRGAAREAADALEAAVAAVEALRKKNRTSRTWNPKELKLDRASFDERLKGVMASALQEIEELDKEHDLGPEGIAETDPILDRINSLLESRIGAPFESLELRHLVDEAVNFRYPNEIPPGYCDAKKDRVSNVVAAGDFLLWWETIRRAKTEQTSMEVMLVTSDTKPDWWRINDKKKVVGPRPELVQEMADEAGKRLTLATLSDFLRAAQHYLSATVSTETIEEVRSAEGDVAGRVLTPWFRSTVHDAFASRPFVLENIVRAVLQFRGYTSYTTQSTTDSGIDAYVRKRGHPDSDIIAVQVKLYRFMVPSSAIERFSETFRTQGIHKGIFVTNGRFSAEATEAAQRLSIELVDGQDLARGLDTLPHVRQALMGALDDDSGPDESE